MLRYICTRSSQITSAPLLQHNSKVLNRDLLGPPWGRARLHCVRIAADGEQRSRCRPSIADLRFNGWSYSISRDFWGYLPQWRMNPRQLFASSRRQEGLTQRVAHAHRGVAQQQSENDIRVDLSCTITGKFSSNSIHMSSGGIIKSWRLRGLELSQLRHVLSIGFLLSLV